MAGLDTRPIADEDPVSAANSSVSPASSSVPGDVAHAPFRSVGFNLSSLGYAVSRGFRETLQPLALEPREFALLRAVAAAEGQSQQALGERLQIPASRMVAFVDALQRRGLLERRPNPQDRRAHALHLTKRGQDMLARGMRAASAFEAELCADLDTVERERLLDLLQRVMGRLGLSPGVHSAHVDDAFPDE